MNFLIVLFMAFMVFAMFVIDHHLCQLGEKLDDIKTLMENLKKFESYIERKEDEGR